MQGLPDPPRDFCPVTFADTVDLLGGGPDGLVHFSKMLGEFLGSSPMLMADLRGAIADGNAQGTAHRAHLLRTRCATLACRKAQALAIELENLAREALPSWQGVATRLLDDLEQSLTAGLAAARRHGEMRGC